VARKPVIPSAPAGLRTFLERLVVLLNETDDLSLDNVARVLGMPLADFEWKPKIETAFNFVGTTSEFADAWTVLYHAGDLRRSDEDCVWLHLLAKDKRAFDWHFARHELAEILGPTEVQWAPRKDKNDNSPGGWVRYASTRDPRMSLMALFDVSKSDRAIMYFDAVTFEMKKASKRAQ
jgi:hypothetical protein